MTPDFALLLVARLQTEACSASGRIGHVTVRASFRFFTCPPAVIGTLRRNYGLWK